jgi:hypothetical protein
MTTYNYIQITYSVCYHICITYGYIHSIYFTYGYIQFTYWPFSTAFGDSDDEGGQDPSFDGGPDLAGTDVEPDAHDPAPVTAAPDPQAPLPGPASTPPFHFMNFISKTGGANFQTCIKDMDRQMQDYPLHVPSERPGGHARRELLKQRASTISRSQAEAFAFSTSKTLSLEDTDDFLQAFGNVIQHIQVVNLCEVCIITSKFICNI